MQRSVHLLVHTHNAVSVTFFRGNRHTVYSNPSQTTLQFLYVLIWHLASNRQIELYPCLTFPGWTAFFPTD